jgi:four helix bundle protein
VVLEARLGAVRSFRELLVWQRSVELTVAVYRLTKLFPKDEMFGLTSQLRRAAVSIPSNIAEGQGRATRGEFLQFLGIARGSAFEVQTQLLIARQLEYGSEELLVSCEGLGGEVGKMLNALTASLTV